MIDKTTETNTERSTRRLRRFGPKRAEDVLQKYSCDICKHVFVEGDYTTLIVSPNTAQDPVSNNQEAVEICWNHAQVIGYITNTPVSE